jgi:hypothetical protein
LTHSLCPSFDRRSLLHAGAAAGVFTAFGSGAQADGQSAAATYAAGAKIAFDTDLAAFANEIILLGPESGKRGKFLGGWAWQGLGSVIHPMDGVAP